MSENELKNTQNITVVKLYNQTNNFGILSLVDENNIQLSCKYYKILDGKEVLIDPPEGIGSFDLILPADLDHSKDALIVDPMNNMIINNAQGVETIPIEHEKFLAVCGADAQKKVKNLSEGDQLLLFDCVSQKKGGIASLEGRFIVPVNEEDLETLFPTSVPATMYSIVKPETEFGVARFIADKVRHLSSLLCEADINHRGDFNYEIAASKPLSADSRLDFSYRFTAKDTEDALEISQRLKMQLNGIMRKIWLAAWAVGDEKKKHTFSVSLLNLMRTCYPERTSNFSESEMQTFYQLLKSMKPAEFVYVKKFQKKGKGSSLVEHEAKFIISLLQVHYETGEKNKTPTDVVISLYNVTPLPTKKEKNRFIGASIKRNTLKLHAKDTALALFLQIKINQLRGGGKKKKEIYSHDFCRAELIEAANLQKTNTANPRMANKQLLEKLSRCQIEGILKTIPKKIEELVRLEW